MVFINNFYEVGSTVNLSLISNWSSLFSIFSLNLVYLPFLFCSSFLFLIIGITIYIKENKQQIKNAILNIK